MKHYMLFLREDLQAVKQMSPEALQADIKEYMHWVEELAKTGHFLSGEPLEPEGTYLSADGQLQTDGPFIEAKEALSGYFMIQATSREQAIEIAEPAPF
ncbi:YciI family protein [Cesiribacter andamanensis]|uniref:YCII-related domain-containing protein n=1 Tax=Cesiribacter andamanensis AMV16 TaxID=1279009 RepID=M7NMY6_9BACT|nr:YciI family protein [Cesiribacter andamanensis]EMR03115.1 hypothetical protein ADICEAN_01775 [Cesiribacter andamanensis AMV16]